MKINQNSFSVKDLKGCTQIVTRCTEQDVERHFKLVKHLIPENDRVAYKERMLISVDAKMAFCVGDKCFIYMRKNRPCTADAYSFYGKDANLETLAMFCCILLIVDKRLLKISFNLHAGRTLSDFKSIVPTFSIRRQATPNMPVIVRCDHLRSKFFNIYDKRGIKWEV